GVHRVPRPRDLPAGAGFQPVRRLPARRARSARDAMSHTTNDAFLSRDGESTMDRSLRFRRSSSLLALATVAALAACKENTGTERVVTDANEVAQQGAVALVND